MAGHPPDQPGELDDLVPVPLVGAETDDAKRVTLLRPRFLKGPLAWWLQPRLPRPHIRVHLDEIGSFIWSLLDGQATVACIAEEMERQFGDRVSPALPRLCLFLRELRRAGMIRLQEPDPCSLA